MPFLTSIAESLLAKAKEIDSYLDSKSLTPSYDYDVFRDMPTELRSVRNTLANDCNDLGNIMRGPIGTTMDIAFSVSEQFIRVCLPRTLPIY